MASAPDKDESAAFTASIAVIQLAVPNYRRQFFDLLANSADLLLVSGVRSFDPSITTSEDIADRPYAVTVKTFFAGGFAVQPQSVLHGVRAQICVFEANPRILSNWVILVLRRVLGRETVAWGHRRGTNSGLIALIRRSMFRLANRQLYYMPAEVEAGNTTSLAAHNSLFRSSEIFAAPDEAAAGIHVLSVGRQVPAKRPDLLVAAVAVLNDEGVDCSLTFIGSGPEERDLRSQASSQGLEGIVHFRPPAFKVEELRAAYSASTVAATGGYVGLNLTQALCFGRPFLFPAAADHSPEVELAESVGGAYSFDPPTPREIADSLLRVHELKPPMQLVVKTMHDYYSIEVMVSQFLKAAAGLKDGESREPNA